MKTIRAKQAEVHSAYFVQGDQHGIVAKYSWLNLMESSILRSRFRFSCRRSFLNSLLPVARLTNKLIIHGGDG